MAITVDGPTTESSISRDGGRYIYYVHGLTGTTVQNLATALAQSAIPIKGQPNPQFPNLVAGAPTASDGPTNGVRVEVDWAPPDGATRPEEELQNDGDLLIGSGTILEQVSTNRDHRGEPLDIPYDPTESAAGVDEPDSLTSISFVGETTVLVPRETIIITRREDKFPSRISDFVGKMNDGPWLANLRKSSNRHTWLCLSAAFPETELRAPWFVTYEFAFNPDTWNKAIYLIDPSTGAPYTNVGKLSPVGNPPRLPEPKKIVNGAGVFQVQGEVNYRRLNFRFARPRAAR